MINKTLAYRICIDITGKIRVKEQGGIKQCVEKTKVFVQS